jgi:hypothetical protein
MSSGPAWGCHELTTESHWLGTSLLLHVLLVMTVLLVVTLLMMITLLVVITLLNRGQTAILLVMSVAILLLVAALLLVSVAVLLLVAILLLNALALLVVLLSDFLTLLAVLLSDFLALLAVLLCYFAILLSCLFLLLLSVGSGGTEQEQSTNSRSEQTSHASISNNPGFLKRPKYAEHSTNLTSLFYILQPVAFHRHANFYTIP